ncbi:MAG TPA: hypothetical protein VK963_01320 [Candidatus Saccharimonadales bacterium]|nr:hypothetical protein [Candidatus Saccharimonadales bacterium]
MVDHDLLDMVVDRLDPEAITALDRDPVSFSRLCQCWQTAGRPHCDPAVQVEALDSVRALEYELRLGPGAAQQLCELLTTTAVSAA